jgi:hypothetical protein
MHCSHAKKGPYFLIGGGWRIFSEPEDMERLQGFTAHDAIQDLLESATDRPRRDWHGDGGTAGRRPP